MAFLGGMVFWRERENKLGKLVETHEALNNGKNCGMWRRISKSESKHIF